VSGPGSLDGQVALVTGAANGIGQCIAADLARRGAHVFGVDLAESGETAGLIETAGDRYTGLTADVRDGAAMIAAADEALTATGRIDVLVSNAGVTGFGAVAEMDEAAWRRVIDVNLTGAFNTFRAVLPHMIEREAGRIVAIASFAGRQTMPSAGSYQAAKMGVIALMKTAALEAGSAGVTVNAVCPGPTATGMTLNETAYRYMRPDLEAPTSDDVVDAFKQMTVLPVPWAEAEDIANAVAFLVSPDARYISGAVLDVACGMSARIQI